MSDPDRTLRLARAIIATSAPVCVPCRVIPCRRQPARRFSQKKKLKISRFCHKSTALCSWSPEFLPEHVHASVGSGGRGLLISQTRLPCFLASDLVRQLHKLLDTQGSVNPIHQLIGSTNSLAPTTTPRSDLTSPRQASSTR